MAGTWLLIAGTLGVGAIGIVAVIIISGFQEMAGKHQTKVIRKRKDFPSVEDWLLSAKQKRTCEFGLGSKLVKMKSAAEIEAWDVRTAPSLIKTGKSHFYGILGDYLTRLLLPDLVVRPESVVIHAPRDKVWEALLDFESYPKWNPLHRNVDIVEREDNTVRVSMLVDLGSIIGKQISEEEIFYVDTSRHIFIYGVDDAVPNSLRVVWLDDASDGKHTVFNSYDCIGGYPALFSRGYIASIVHDGFTKQHIALKEYVESLS